MLKLAGASAHCPDLRRRISHLLQQECLLILLDRAKGERPVKILRRDIVIVLAAQPNAEFPDVPAVRDGGVILQLVIIFRIERTPHLRPTLVERPQHLDLRRGTIGDTLLRAAEILKASLIDADYEDRGINGAYRLIGVLVVVTERKQIEAADARSLDVGARKRVAKNQRVGGVQLVIHARAHSRVALRDFEDAEKGLSREILRIQRDGVDDGAVIHRVALRVEVERGSFVDGTAGFAFQLIEQQRGFLGGKRIARVPDVVRVVVMQLAVESIRPGLGEDLGSGDLACRTRARTDSS